MTQTVNKCTTITVLVSSANPSVYGQSVTFTAMVNAAASGTSTPSGTVTFMDGTTVLGSGVLASGAATFTTTSLSAAMHTITAIYIGDSHFAASTAAGLSQTVTQLCCWCCCCCC